MAEKEFPVIDWRPLYEDALVYHVVDVRLFVMGVEVSDWLGSISATINRNDPNTCEITLRNPNDIWTLTHANLAENKWCVIDDNEVNELPKNKLCQYKMQHNLYDEQKQGKATVKFARWNMTINSLIFHSGDTVRAFVKVPWAGDEDCWIPFFCGYVVSVTGERDLMTNMGSVTLSCQDLKWVLSKARVVQNKVGEAFVDAGLTESVIVDTEETFMFKDIRSMNAVFTQTQAELTCTGIINAMFYGDSAAYRYPEFYGDKYASMQKSKLLPRAVGNLDPILYKEITYRNGVMKDWFNSELLGINAPYVFTYDNVTICGEGSDFYGDYAPHGKLISVRALLPPGGYGFKTISDMTVDASAQDVEFASRLDILNSFLEPLDLDFIVTPFGDCVFEFPRYDFDLVATDNERAERVKKDWGDYVNLWVLANMGTNIQISDSSSETVNTLVVTGGIEGYNYAVSDSSVRNISKGVVINRPMILRHGINASTINFPYTLDCDKLMTFGCIRMMRDMSKATTFNLTGFFFLPYMLPNYVVYFELGECYALIESVSHSISMEKDISATTELSLSSFRFADKDGKYLFITGSETGFIAYNTFFEGNAGQISQNVGVKCTDYKNNPPQKSNYQRQDLTPIEMEERDLGMYYKFAPEFQSKPPSTGADATDGANAAVTGEKGKDVQPTKPEDDKKQKCQKATEALNAATKALLTEDDNWHSKGLPELLNQVHAELNKTGGVGDSYIKMQESGIQAHDAKMASLQTAVEQANETKKSACG